MTLAQAISLRSRQLAGEAVSLDDLDAAMAVIRAKGDKPAPRARKVIGANTATKKIISRLVAGPQDRESFYAEARKDFAHNAYSAIGALVRRGLIKCEVKLTDEGLRALGLKGPQS